MISMKHFKKIIWTHILIADTRFDLMEAIKQFQYDHPEIKIKDIKYNHAMSLNHSGDYSSITNIYSAMIIYK